MQSVFLEHCGFMLYKINYYYYYFYFLSFIILFLTQMLHAEQWGLEHGLLFALANCPGNEPMLLAPCDNELVHYQSVTTGGMGSEVLHAGMPLGLMAYLFGQ